MAPATLADVPETVRPYVLNHRPVGSSTIPGCDPKDRDLLLLVKDQLRTVYVLRGLGFSLDGDYLSGGSDFTSVRKGDLNVIVTRDATYFRAFSIAHELCVKACVTNKPARVFIHNAIISSRADLPS